MKIGLYLFAAKKQTLIVMLSMLILAGCSGSSSSGGGNASSGTGYCRIAGAGTKSTCEDWSTAASQQNAGVSCQASGGSWSGTACSILLADGYDGYCTGNVAGGETAVNYYHYGQALASSQCPSAWHSSSVPVPVVGNQLGGTRQGSALNLAGVVTSPIMADVAGTAQNPLGLTTDGTYLYVADTYKIRKINISTGIETTLAGSGVAGHINGIGTAASFGYAMSITTDGTNVYVADSDNVIIRQVNIATGAVTTLAGSGVTGALDGTGTAAQFSYPDGITTDGVNLYVSNGGIPEIRKIAIATGVVTTIAGSSTAGSTDGTGTAATFSAPYGLTTDGVNLYVLDGNKIRKIVIATGVVTTLAGSGTSGSNDGIGTAASFWAPRDITTDGTNLYVTDNGNFKIRKIVAATGIVTTLAGGTQGAADGTGAAASFSNIVFGIITNDISLYVSDSNNHKIRKID